MLVLIVEQYQIDLVTWFWTPFSLCIHVDTWPGSWHRKLLIWLKVCTFICQQHTGKTLQFSHRHSAFLPYFPERKCSECGGKVVFLFAFSTHIKMSLKLVKIKCTKFSMENLLRSAGGVAEHREPRCKCHFNAWLGPQAPLKPLKPPSQPRSPSPGKTLLCTHLSSHCCCWLFAGWLVVLFCGCLARPLNLRTPEPPRTPWKPPKPPPCTSFACNSFS